MFVPREKNINVIEESFVLLKPDVAESHGILIDIFTNAGFSVTAKKIPRSQAIVEKIVDHFPVRAVGHAASGRRHYDRLVSGIKKEQSASPSRRVAGGGGASSPHSLAQTPGALGGSGGLPAVKRDDDDSGGVGDEDGQEKGRMRSHRGAITGGTLQDSPMEHFMKAHREHRLMSGDSLLSSGAAGLMNRSALSGATSASGGGGGAATAVGAGSESPRTTWNFGGDTTAGSGVFGGGADGSPSRAGDSFGYTRGTAADQPPTYSEQLRFINTGTCLALVLTSVNAVEAAKLLCGPHENPAVAREQDASCIRAEFGVNYLRNAVFCAPSHDVASELIELVFGYKTQTRTEVVRFAATPGANNAEQQRELMRAKQLQSGTRIADLEAEDTDTLSAALDAAIFGADIAAPPDVYRRGVDGAAASPAAFDPTAAALHFAPSSVVALRPQDEREQELRRGESILRAREIDLILRERALAESAWTFRGSGVRCAEPPGGSNAAFAGAAAADGRARLMQDGRRLSSPTSQQQQQQPQQPQHGRGAANSSRSGGPTAVFIPDSLLANSQRHNQGAHEQGGGGGGAGRAKQHSYGAAQWVPLHFADSRSDQFKVIFASPADSLPQQFNVSLARQRELEGQGHAVVHHGNRGDAGAQTMQLASSSGIAPAPPRREATSRWLRSNDPDNNGYEDDEDERRGDSMRLLKRSMNPDKTALLSRSRRESFAFDVGDDGPRPLAVSRRQSSVRLLGDTLGSSNSNNNEGGALPALAGVQRSKSLSSNSGGSPLLQQQQQQRGGVDPALLYEAGSDRVKLANLFEHFERRMRVPPPPQQHTVRFGRCVPKADVVDFVVKAIVQGGSSTLDPVGALDDSALCKPLIAFIEKNCGRAGTAGGTAWITFDEFTIICMKVLQM